MKRSTKHEKKMRWLAENETFLEAHYPGMAMRVLLAPAELLLKQETRPKLGESKTAWSSQ